MNEFEKENSANTEENPLVKNQSVDSETVVENTDENQHDDSGIVVENVNENQPVDSETVAENPDENQPVDSETVAENADENQHDDSGIVEENADENQHDDSGIVVENADENQSVDSETVAENTDENQSVDLENADENQLIDSEIVIENADENQHDDSESVVENADENQHDDSESVAGNTDENQSVDSEIVIENAGENQSVDSETVAGNANENQHDDSETVAGNADENQQIDSETVVENAGENQHDDSGIVVENADENQRVDTESFAENADENQHVDSGIVVENVNENQHDDSETVAGNANENQHDDSETAVENQHDDSGIVVENADENQSVDSEIVIENADGNQSVDSGTFAENADGNQHDDSETVAGNANENQHVDSETVAENADENQHDDSESVAENVNENQHDDSGIVVENADENQHDDSEAVDEIIVDEFVDEEPLGEPISIQVDRSENQDENLPAETEENGLEVSDDSKLRIDRKYDLSSREAIREAAKILRENREKAVVRDIPYKKLPFIFKRGYTEGSLKRRILKKIYIPEDRKDVENLFKNGVYNERSKRYYVPEDSLFSKKEIKRYRSLAKEIKNQNKFRIRMIPLAAAVAVIVLAVSWIIANKNRIVRDFIVATFQAVFQAKTDIDYVNVKILDASITIGGMKVGNRNSVMKNLFEVNRIQLDFDLVQLLKKRFVCENLEASGIAWNTDRATSCALSDNPPTGSAFSQELQRRLTNSINALKNQAYDLLGGSDVESIVANFMSNINTPEMIEKTISDMNAIYDKWKDRPAEYEAEIKKFTESVKDLQNINLKAFDIRNPNDYARLVDALEKIKAAIETGQSLTKTIQQAVIDIKDEAVNMTTMADNAVATIKADTDYIVERFTTITGTLTNLNGLMNSALNTIAYNMLGNLYPYVMDGMAMLQTMNADSKPKEKKEKKESRRAPGTDFYFTPACPSMLIKNVLISGTGFTCTAREITNNQNVRNIPTTVKLVLNIKGITHEGWLTYDARKTSSAPLVSAGYIGRGYDFNIDGSKIAKKCGVPTITGKATVSVSGSGGPNGFSAQGSMDLNPVSMSSDGFENEYVTKYYAIGLSAVDRLAFGFDLGYDKNSGFYLKLDGNFAEQFTNSLKKVVMELGKDVKAAAMKKLEDFLNNSQNEVLLKAKEFFNVQENISLQDVTLKDVQKLLLEKKTDIENLINGKISQVKEEVTAKVEEKVNEVKQQAGAIIEEKTNELKKTVTDSIGGFLGGGLGGKKNESKTEDDADGEDKADEKKDGVSDAINSYAGVLLKGFGF